MSVGWNLNDSTTSLPSKIYFLFQQNDCTPPICGELSEYTDSVHTDVEGLSSFLHRMWDNCQFPRLDRMKLVRNRTIPITLPSGNNILADTVFKISIGHTNLGTNLLNIRYLILYLASLKCHDSSLLIATLLVANFGAAAVA